VTGFLLAALVLLLLGAALLAWRRDGIREADLDDPNLNWYRQRAKELSGDDGVLLEEVQLRLLEDGVAPEASASDLPSTRFPVLPLMGLMLLISGFAYWHLGAMEDVLIYQSLNTLSPEDGEPARRELVERIAARSAVREDNLQYLSLLGQLYMADEDYAAASDSFSRLVASAPEDPQALALAAQARFLAQDRTLDEQAQLLAERALAVDPRQRTALGLLGMAAFEAQSYQAAVTYWERLQAQEAPGSPGYNMLDEVLSLARERGGIAVDEATERDGVAPASDAGGISVALALAEGESADPAATVFVFARSATAAGGIPIAVRRLQAADLPITLRLNDADAMTGQLLSEAGAVEVAAQVSVNGRPGQANALFAGVAGPVNASEKGAAVSILLRPTANPG